jgi:hypothetical protein
LAKNSVAEQKKKSAINAVKTNEKKWGKSLMEAGWTAFPSTILQNQQALGLDALDINIILYLSTYWWESENKPHPAKKTIALDLGVDPRTVQRRIAKLEAKGLVRREYRKDKNEGNNTNKYHFDGLIKASEPHALAKLDSIESRKASKNARKLPPKLKAVPK